MPIVLREITASTPAGQIAGAIGLRVWIDLNGFCADTDIEVDDPIKTAIAQIWYMIEAEAAKSGNVDGIWYFTIKTRSQGERFLNGKVKLDGVDVVYHFPESMNPGISQNLDLLEGEIFPIVKKLFVEVGGVSPPPTVIESSSSSSPSSQSVSSSSPSSTSLSKSDSSQSSSSSSSSSHSPQMPWTRELVIEGPGTGGTYSFSLVAGGTSPIAFADSNRGISINPSDVVSGLSVSGAVGGGKDGWQYTGVIESFTISPNSGGSVTLELDGNPETVQSIIGK